MKSRMYWGIATLIILLIGVSIFLTTRTTDTEPEEVYEPLTPSEKAEVDRNIQDAIDKAKQNDPPIVEGEGDASHHPAQTKPMKRTSQPEAEAPKPEPKKSLFTGPLTFHKELLKTNPVKALRLQQEERGHWSAEWIPPFPTDDTEAQEYARVTYLRIYYIQNYGFEKLDTPEYEKETKAYSEADAIESQLWRNIKAYPYGARQMDLMKLTWPSLDEEPRINYHGGFPSEYFGDPEMRAFLKEHGAWDY